MYKLVSLLVVIVLLNACSPNNITKDDSLATYFTQQQLKGSFAIFDNNKGAFTIYNLSHYKDSAYQPSSTFNIVNSLIGLQTGVITNEKTAITINTNNQVTNITLAEAFKNTELPYFQAVAKTLGKEKMQFWLDSIGYTKTKITTAIDSFWVDNSLKITADEQLGLVKKLYFNQLPFNKTVTETVKKLMLQQENANYTLAYTTGLGNTEKGTTTGWVVGWIVENKHPHFFVLNTIGSANANTTNTNLTILKNCLSKLGYLQGKM